MCCCLARKCGGPMPSGAGGCTRHPVCGVTQTPQLPPNDSVLAAGGGEGPSMCGQIVQCCHHTASECRGGIPKGSQSIRCAGGAAGGCHPAPVWAGHGCSCRSAISGVPPHWPARQALKWLIWASAKEVPQQDHCCNLSHS